MYILEKVGVYGQGVFWAGESLEDGIEEAKKAAKLDADDYHTWEVKEVITNDENYKKRRADNVVVCTIRQRK